MYICVQRERDFLTNIFSNRFATIDGIGAIRFSSSHMQSRWRTHCAIVKKTQSTLGFSLEHPVNSGESHVLLSMEIRNLLNEEQYLDDPQHASFKQCSIVRKPSQLTHSMGQTSPLINNIRGNSVCRSFQNFDKTQLWKESKFIWNLKMVSKVRFSFPKAKVSGKQFQTKDAETYLTMENVLPHQT